MFSAKRRSHVAASLILPRAEPGADHTPQERRPRRLMQAPLEQPARHHDCRYYPCCLDEACEGRWESWSCTGCGAFERAARPITSNNRGQDY
jgi:hypothetical protein